MRAPCFGNSPIPWWIASIPFESDVLWNEHKRENGVYMQILQAPLVKKEYFILSKEEIRFAPFKKKKVCHFYQAASSYNIFVL